MYAYALDGVEQEAIRSGGSVIEARESFERRLTEVAELDRDAPEQSEPRPPRQSPRQQRDAQQQLMSLMARARA